MTETITLILSVASFTLFSLTGILCFLSAIAFKKWGGFIIASIMFIGACTSLSVGGFI